MRRSERTLLLLCGMLDDGLQPLSPAEYRTLALRVSQVKPSDGSFSEEFLRALGYQAAAAERIAALLERQAALDVFLARAASRGVTVLTAAGGYSRRSAPALLCVVSRTEVHALRDLVFAHDPQAFFVLLPTAEILGFGFTTY